MIAALRRRRLALASFLRHQERVVWAPLAALALAMTLLASTVANTMFVDAYMDFDGHGQQIYEWAYGPLVLMSWLMLLSSAWAIRHPFRVPAKRAVAARRGAAGRDEAVEKMDGVSGMAPLWCVPIAVLYLAIALLSLGAALLLPSVA